MDSRRIYHRRPTTVLKLINLGSSTCSLVSLFTVIYHYESVSRILEDALFSFNDISMIVATLIFNALGLILLVFHQFRVPRIYKKSKLSLCAHIIIIAISPITSTSLLICIPYSYTYTCYSIPDLLLLLMLLRIFPFILSLLQFTSYYTDYDSINFPLLSPSFFACKCVYTYHKAMFHLFLFLLGMVLAGYGLKISERRADPDGIFEDLRNCIWNTFVTGDNIGFGDMYPKTVLGRAIISVWAVTGGVFIWLYILAASDVFTLTHREFYVYRDINLAEKAGRLICKFIGRKEYCKELKEFKEERNRLYKGQLCFGQVLNNFSDKAPRDFRKVHENLKLLEESMNKLLESVVKASRIGRERRK